MTKPGFQEIENTSTIADVAGVIVPPHSPRGSTAKTLLRAPTIPPAIQATNTRCPIDREDRLLVSSFLRGIVVRLTSVKSLCENKVRLLCRELLWPPDREMKSRTWAQSSGLSMRQPLCSRANVFTRSKALVLLCCLMKTVFKLVESRSGLRLYYVYRYLN